MMVTTFHAPFMRTFSSEGSKPAVEFEGLPSGPSIFFEGERLIRYEKA